MNKFQRVKTDQHFCDLVDLHIELFSGGVQEVPSRTIGAWWVGYDLCLGPVAFGGIHPSTQYKKTGYLCRVGVAFNARGQGLQKKLIKIREKWARKQGYEWVITDTAPDNPASSNSLISCGYKLWIPKRKWAEYAPALYWRKIL